MNRFQKRIPLTACGMKVFACRYPETLILEDDEEICSLHIYELDETESAKTVIVAYGLDYRFSRLATKEEESEMRKQRLTGELKHSPDMEDITSEFAEILAQAEQINSLGSRLEN
jgi:hypothetical protein